MDEKITLYCPRCGPVEGYAPDDEPIEQSPMEAESVIDEEVVSTPAGPATRVRCPKCGDWMQSDRQQPAD